MLGGTHQDPPGEINHDFDGHLEYPDAGGVGGGGSTDDLASGPIDAGPVVVPADLSGPPANGMTGCLGEIMCANGCPTGATAQACIDGCTANTTTNGDQLFQSLLTCIDNACPGTKSTDACYNASSTKCNNCVSSSQNTSGACANAQMACAASTP